MLLFQIIFLLFGFSTDCSTAANSKSAPKIQPAPTVSPSQTVLPKVQTDKNTIWQGESANFDIKWTKDDVTARNPNGAEVFSVRKFATKKFKDSLADFSKNGEMPFEEYTFRYKILSIAGSLMFLQETTSYSPQSYLNESYVAIDLSDPKATRKLTDFYSETEILNALLKNQLIAEDLKADDVPAPKNLTEFFTAFDREPTEATEKQIDKCRFAKNVFDSFAFNRVENDKIAVDLGVPCRAEMRADKIYPFELLLPVKAELKTDGKQNFKLKTAGTEETTIKFAAKPLAKSK